MGQLQGRPPHMSLVPWEHCQCMGSHLHVCKKVCTGDALPGQGMGRDAAGSSAGGASNKHHLARQRGVHCGLCAVSRKIFAHARQGLRNGRTSAAGRHPLLKQGQGTTSRAHTLPAALA